LNFFVISLIALSTGTTLQSEHVQQAEYYSRGSLPSNALLYALSARRKAELEIHEQSFLYIRTIEGSVHVRGKGAAGDATALEEAGVRVYRSPIAAALADS
jgi:hypothetical protein